jgi:hypothetical protein
MRLIQRIRQRGCQETTAGHPNAVHVRKAIIEKTHPLREAADALVDLAGSHAKRRSF